MYGLGFLSEAELNQFIEQFQEVKEATRSSAKSQTNGRGSQPQDGPTPTIPPPSMSMMTGSSPYSTQRHGVSPGGQDEDHRNSNEANANSTLKGVSVAHQRSQSLTAVVPGGGSITTESPKHGATAGGKPDLIGQSPETQLKYENERLRQALAQRYD